MIKITVQRGGQTSVHEFIKDKDAEKFLKAIHDDKMIEAYKANYDEDLSIKDPLTVKIEHV